MNAKQVWLLALVMITLPTLIILCCEAAEADTLNSTTEPWVELHIGSRHAQSHYYDKAGEKHALNESNTGIGVMFPVNKNLEVGFGGYRNSYNRNTFYSGFDLHTDSYGTFARYGVSVAIMTGYENTPTPTNIMVLPNLTIGNDHIRLKFGYLPGPKGLVTLTAGVRF